MYKNLKLLLFLIAIFFTQTSCSIDEKNSEKRLRLGYMPNVTHSTALIGIEGEVFQRELGGSVQFKPIHFIVGNSIIDAFATGQLDVAYVGPGPFINAVYRGIPVDLIANSANSGTIIVADKKIDRLESGMRIAIPQFGNTQDLILRQHLEQVNLANKLKIIAIPNQDIGTAFFTMSIDAACLPEPWGTILIKKDICKLIINEKEISNNGEYPVTVLIANRKFVKNHPELMKRILKAHNASNELILKDPKRAITMVSSLISKISKKPVDNEVISKSFKRCVFINDIDLNSLKEYAKIGVKAGYYRDDFLNRKDAPWNILKTIHK